MSASPLPFSVFLSELQRAQFTIGVDSYLRLERLLEQYDGAIPPARLKTALCPLVATGPEEQRRFYEIFDRYYGMAEQTSVGVEKTVMSGKAETRTRRRLWVWTAEIVATLIGIFALLAYLYSH